MFGERELFVVVPAYQEEETIAGVVEEYLRVEEVDRVVVVDNGSSDATAARAREAGGHVVEELLKGYGHAIRRGLDHAFAAGADVAVVTEADGSFRASDLKKLLMYVDDCALVLGTRTTRQLVEQGANMGTLLRWGNVAMAKWLELLWFFPDEPRLTDVGCTLRALKAGTWRVLREETREPGPAFSPEMIAAAYARGLRVIEVPVTYRARRGGASKHTGDPWAALRTAWSMFRAICKQRLHRGDRSAG